MSPNTQADTQSEMFLQHLPAIYKAQPELAVMLRPFEAVLLGGKARKPGDGAGLREIILSLPTFLDPDTTPSEFLPWLATWLAFNLRADLAEERKRLLIRRASSLFACRGTIRGLRELLQIVAGEWVQPPDLDHEHSVRPDDNQEPRIVEPTLQSLIVGVQAVVGSTTRLGREMPYLFEVTFTLPEPLPRRKERIALERLVRDTIELGKPAHTYYNLKFTDSKGNPVAPLSERGSGDDDGTSE
jgi:phage tail-like protein